jgi:hypothetical protein
MARRGAKALMVRAAGKGKFFGQKYGRKTVFKFVLGKKWGMRQL